jgi:hypothetical protein
MMIITIVEIIPSKMDTVGMKEFNISEMTEKKLMQIIAKTKTSYGSVGIFIFE